MIVDKIREFLSTCEQGLDDKQLMQVYGDYIREFQGELQTAILSKLLCRYSGNNLRLSMIGWCPRKQWYTINDPESNHVSPELKVRFFYGDMIEELVVLLARMAGVRIEGSQATVDFNGVKGHIDGAVLHDGEWYLFECKSMADSSFKRFVKEGPSDDFGYISQQQSYMGGKSPYQFVGSVMVGMNKETGELHEVIIEPSVEHQDRLCTTIDTLREAIKNNEPPSERKYGFYNETYRKQPTGRRILDWRCNTMCKYVDKCWEGQFTMDIKGGKPIRVAVGSSAVADDPWGEPTVGDEW